MRLCLGLTLLIFDVNSGIGYIFPTYELVSGVARNFSRGGFSKFLYGKNFGEIFGIFSQKP